MTCILDTHAFIWSILDPGKLSDRARRLVEDGANEVLVSAVSLWEIALKTGIGKFSFEGLDTQRLSDYAAELGFALVALEPGEAETFSRLPVKEGHRDPFDRMLVWQAIRRDIPLLSRDAAFRAYEAEGLRLVW